jgi:hypothetical protein
MHSGTSAKDVVKPASAFLEKLEDHMGN